MTFELLRWLAFPLLMYLINVHSGAQSFAAPNFSVLFILLFEHNRIGGLTNE